MYHARSLSILPMVVQNAQVPIDGSVAWLRFSIRIRKANRGKALQSSVTRDLQSSVTRESTRSLPTIPWQGCHTAFDRNRPWMTVARAWKPTDRSAGADDRDASLPGRCGSTDAERRIPVLHRRDASAADGGLDRPPQDQHQCRLPLGADALGARPYGGRAPAGASTWPITVSSAVLYSLWIIPDYLKYDQIVHAFGFGVTTCLCWEGLRASIGSAGIAPFPTVGRLILCTAAGTGFGALNELVEFTATLLLPSTNVGGYATRDGTSSQILSVPRWQPATFAGEGVDRSCSLTGPVN